LTADHKKQAVELISKRFDIVAIQEEPVKSS
jgi:hypothetical protein